MAAVLVPDWTSREPLGHGHATGTPRQKVLFSHEPSPDPHSEAIPGKISAVFKSKAMGTPLLLLGCPSPAVRLSLQNQLCRSSRRGLLPFSPHTSPSVTFFLCPQHAGPRPTPHAPPVCLMDLSCSLQPGCEVGKWRALLKHRFW